MHQLFSAGGSTLGDLLQALEDYLPVLLGLVKDGNARAYRVLVAYSLDIRSDFGVFVLCREPVTAQGTVCLG